MDHLSGPQNSGKTRVLVAPLDWGLGHATRCIPIIQALLDRDCEVWLAGEGAQKTLLQTEFPQLPFLDLPGYRIRYAKTRMGLFWKMIGQAPKMKKAIRREHEWLKNVIQEHQFQIIISDNRYGLYASGVTTAFITHQLAIKSPLGKWTERILQKKNYGYINKFTICYVPDSPANDGLGGELSHPVKKPAIPTRYIGRLSRLNKKTIAEKKGHLLIVLSGPEPQRSLLEEIVIRDIVQYPFSAVIVRGLPDGNTIIPSTGMIRFYNHLSSEEMNNAMLEAEYVISRSGYSTVMDIAALGKKAILIPTPGQTEQEYLGKYLEEKKFAIAVDQDQFVLETALTKARAFAYHSLPSTENNLLHDALDDLLASISTSLKK